MEGYTIFLDEYLRVNNIEKDDVIHYYKRALKTCKKMTDFELYTFISVWLNSESEFPDFIKLFNKRFRQFYCKCSRYVIEEYTFDMICDDELYAYEIDDELIESAIKDYILSQDKFPELVNRIRKTFIITHHGIIYTSKN